MRLIKIRVVGHLVVGVGFGLYPVGQNNLKNRSYENHTYTSDSLVARQLV